MMWLIRAWMNQDIEWTESLTKILYSCTTCNNCVEGCKFPFGDEIANIIVAGRQEMVENGLVLPKVKRFFENVEAYSNPYRELRENRNKWAEGTKIKQYSEEEFLYYVGCVGSYDERGQEVARALGDVLLATGVSFGILGSKEECDGNEVKMLGERRIFEMLAEKNIKLFSDLGIKKVVALSPHSYNAFKNYYPNKFEVFHYTQLLCELIKDGRLNVSKGLDAKVTYHDPCFLGRHNSEYETPREVLNAIPGIELVEMERNRENAFCCGGGSGNFYIDSFGGGEYSPARIRIREAYETGANILAVACPICMTMFTDAVKSEELEGKLIVKDISEIVKESL
jgi:Fe-S oxidoreductase